MKQESRIRLNSGGWDAATDKAGTRLEETHALVSFWMQVVKG
ncbi:MAG: hypothetical protein JWL90_882 [Chthoniobacteraceae bacterium]|nr:hypothetical protein [Chthoniobacteraceae bacterium]